MKMLLTRFKKVVIVILSTIIIGIMVPSLSFNKSAYNAEKLIVFLEEVDTNEKIKFIKYMDWKRTYIQDNIRSIKEYIEDYDKELSGFISGVYMRVWGFPTINVQEVDDGSEEWCNWW